MINEYFVTEQLIISPNIKVCQVGYKDIVFNRIRSLAVPMEAVTETMWPLAQSAREHPVNHLPEVALLSQCDCRSQQASNVVCTTHVIPALRTEKFTLTGI